MLITLREFMDNPEGWGRAQGRQVFQRLIDFVEDSPGAVTFRISFKAVRRIDISFAAEAIVELARRYRGRKGFCIVDLVDADMIENLEAAATKTRQPLALSSEGMVRFIGFEPSQGNREALAFALARGEVRAADFSDSRPGISIANASTKFKQLCEQGFLLRRETVADSGGIEFIYWSVA